MARAHWHAGVRHRPRRAVGPQETKLLNKLTSVMLQYTTGMHESKQSNKRSFFQRAAATLCKRSVPTF